MFKCLQIICAKYYELSVPVYVLKIVPYQSCRVCFIESQIHAIFGVLFERRKLIKSKPICKLKHASPILQSFEYFYQMSSKSILTTSSFSVSKLVHFFLRHTVYT